MLPDRKRLSIPLFLYDRQASIFSRTGRLIWFSPAWISADAFTRTELLGLRYLEFMAPGETGRFLRWLMSDEKFVEYHYFSHIQGEWVLVHMAKTRFDAEHWLCLGERLPARRNEIDFCLEPED